MALFAARALFEEEDVEESDEVEELEANEGERERVPPPTAVV